MKESRLFRYCSNFLATLKAFFSRMRAKLFQHTLAQEMAFFDSRTVGDIQVELSTNTTSLKCRLSECDESYGYN